MQLLRVVIRGLLLVVLAACCSSRSDSHAADPARKFKSAYHPPTRSAGADLTDLSHDVAKFKRELTNWDPFPLYVQISICELLIAEIRKPAGRPNKNFEYPATCHDLERTAGRAAFAFGKLLGLELPWVTPRSSQGDLDRIAREAEKTLTIYRAGVIKANSKRPLSAEQEVTIAALVKQIKPATKDSDEAYFSVLSLCEIMSIWSPIGKRVDDFTRVLGTRPMSKTDDGHFAYYFIVGRFHFVFHFFVDNDGRVRSVQLNVVD